MRAEALTYLARTNHALATTQSLQSAFQQYQEASRLDKQAALPILGLAQLTLLNASYRANAAALGMGLLEDALKLAPGWVDALQVGYVVTAVLSCMLMSRFEIVRLSFQPRRIPSASSAIPYI